MWISVARPWQRVVNRLPDSLNPPVRWIVLPWDVANYSLKLYTISIFCEKRNDEESFACDVFAEWSACTSISDDCLLFSHWNSFHDLVLNNSAKRGHGAQYITHIRTNTHINHTMERRFTNILYLLWVGDLCVWRIARDCVLLEKTSSQSNLSRMGSVLVKELVIVTAISQIAKVEAHSSSLA